MATENRYFAWVCHSALYHEILRATRPDAGALPRKDPMVSLVLAAMLAGSGAVPAVRIDADVREALKRFDVPGATIAVIRDGRIVYRRAYGYRDLSGHLPATIDSHYEIGSITKQFTAAAILQLRAAGKVDIDATVATYLPNAPFAKEITLRELLTHTSGLPDYLDDADIQNGTAKPATFDQLMAQIAGKPLLFTPGSKWSYCNTGYIMLGRIIEVVSGQSYHQYIQSHMLNPLGMRQTFTVADEGRISNMAFGYHHKNGRIELAPLIGETYGWSAGDLVSTVDDLARWSNALASGRVVSAADYSLMTTPQMTTLRVNTGYGFGLFIDSMDGQLRIGHTGGTFGSTAADEYFPKQRVRIIAFTNDSEAAAPEAGETITNLLFADLFPDIAAKASRPSPGENRSVTSQVKKLFARMQAGNNDYTMFSPRLASKFKARLARELAAEFAPYGAPTNYIFRGQHADGSLRWMYYDIQFGPGVVFKLGVAFDGAGKVGSLSFG